MPIVSAPMEHMKIKLQTNHLSGSPIKVKYHYN